jgi:sulfite reductase (ferredoxin)
MDGNAEAYGLALLAVPSKRIPEVVDRLAERFVAGRSKDETFKAWVERTGKAQVRKLLEDLAEVPPREADASFYSDWRDPREYGVGDMGVGECAGEVVSAIDFDLAAAERRSFEAQLDLERGDAKSAAAKAVDSMLVAARGLVATQFEKVGAAPADVAREFRERFYDTKIFWDPYAAGRFGAFLFKAVETPSDDTSADAVHRLVEESQLFIEAAHSCALKMTELGMKV